MDAPSIPAADSRNVSPQVTVGQGQNTGNTSTAAAPTVTQKVEVRSSFFDFFRSEKTIERNQKHAILMARIETFSKLETELVKLNTELDELIKKLDVGTGGGAKTFLMTTVDNALVSIKNLKAQMDILVKMDNSIILQACEIDSFYENYKSFRVNRKKVQDLYKKTRNISADVLKKGTEFDRLMASMKVMLKESKRLSQHFHEFHKKYKDELRDVNKSQQSPDGSPCVVDDDEDE